MAGWRQIVLSGVTDVVLAGGLGTTTGGPGRMMMMSVEKVMFRVRNCRGASGRNGAGVIGWGRSGVLGRQGAVTERN